MLKHAEPGRPDAGRAMRAPRPRSRPATSMSSTARSRRCSERRPSTFRDRAVTAFIGPSGCGKSTFLRCINRMNDTIPAAAVTGEIEHRRREHLRPRARRGAAARPRRHGVPEAQSVPEVDLRERRLRPAHPRPRQRQGRARRDRRRRASSSAGLWNEVKDRLRRARHRPFRRPAAAPVHRARHRGQPGGHPDGRAVLGARPDRHGADRGADRRAARRTTASSSSPTRCSRRRGSRSAPPSSISASWSRKAPPTRSSPTRSDKRTQDYITGRFG